MHKLKPLTDRMLKMIKSGSAYWCGMCNKLHMSFSKKGRKHKKHKTRPPLENIIEADDWYVEDEEF